MIRSWSAAPYVAAHSPRRCWTDQGTPGSYAEDFTEAVQGSARLTEFLRLTNTTSISAADMDELLDAWLAGFES